MGVALMKKKHSGKAKGSHFLWFFLGALFISLAVHLFFLKKASSWKVQGFSPEEYDEIVPRTFRMKRVEIDPKTLEEPAPTPVEKKERPLVPIEKEKPVVQTLSSAVTQQTTLSKPEATEVSEKPAANSQPGQALADLLEKAAPGKGGLAIPLPEARDREPQFPAELPTVPDQEQGTGRAEPAPLPGYSSLDSLLAGNTQLTPSTAPILMPTDLLFEYDSATLKPAAEESLAKLGTLISRNAGSLFRIEGHTDSFGSDAYNMELSIRRAEEVKKWLQKNMSIPSDRITTAGFGKTRLLVPATRNIAEQQLNRRVEIVITTPQPPQP